MVQRDRARLTTWCSLASLTSSLHHHDVIGSLKMKHNPPFQTSTESCQRQHLPDKYNKVSQDREFALKMKGTFGQSHNSQSSGKLSGTLIAEKELVFLISFLPGV